MKLHANHYWTPDGRVVVEVRDREPRVLVNEPFAPGSGFRKWRLARVPEVVKTAVFPRGPTGTALKIVKQNLIMLAKIELQKEL